MKAESSNRLWKQIPRLPRQSGWSFRLRLAGGSVLCGGLFLAGMLGASGQQAPRPASGTQAAGGGKETPSEPVPRVAVGEINGTPGASLMIPLYFTPDPQNPLRSLTVEVDYVSNNLKFQKASRGLVTEQAGADVSTTLTDGKPDAKNVTRSKLRISVALMEKDPKQGIPDGLLAYLLFQISMDAKPFAIKLNTAVLAAENIKNPPQKVAKVNTVPGLVVIETPDMMPEATCFFFTH
ncbi:MAG: hypothetical protein A3J28_11340 [Acidobacteria bacterium RIFCSPLOWO2_12_FULL_60_22]|nr:MAG: hypothetical protein A3J28_11340 [Acidobacteria bacterium RIFCSPLOWO2_12_FULL_60_22]